MIKCHRMALVRTFPVVTPLVSGGDDRKSRLKSSVRHDKPASLNRASAGHGLQGRRRAGLPVYPLGALAAAAIADDLDGIAQDVVQQFLRGLRLDVDPDPRHKADRLAEARSPIAGAGVPGGQPDRVDAGVEQLGMVFAYA